MKSWFAVNRRVSMNNLMTGGAELDSIVKLRQVILGWYEEHGRDLPWRSENVDAYRVVVSELMLVQTTVVAVIPYYRRFLERFPTVGELAAADEGEVLKAWEGLGYYRRAKQLHQLAKAVVEKHGGKFPREEKALLALPGVGQYIAGAIRSFAFDEPAPILEANTIRLLARLIGWREAVETTTSQRRLWEEAGRLVCPERPGALNQAIMDLGSMVCTPRQPSCLVCPLTGYCETYKQGIWDQVPLKSPRKPPKLGDELGVVIERPGDEAILLLKRGSKGLWADFWEFPTFFMTGADPAKRADWGFCVKGEAEVPPLIEVLTGLKIGVPEAFTEKPIVYGVTTHRIGLSAVFAKVVDLGETEPHLCEGWAEARFVELGKIVELTMSSAQRALLGKFMEWKEMSLRNPILPKKRKSHNME